MLVSAFTGRKDLLGYYRYAINKKMTPGAQILVARNGDVIYNKSFGKKSRLETHIK